MSTSAAPLPFEAPVHFRLTIPEILFIPDAEIVHDKSKRADKDQALRWLRQRGATGINRRKRFIPGSQLMSPLFHTGLLGPRYEPLKSSRTPKKKRRK